MGGIHVGRQQARPVWASDVTTGFFGLVYIIAGTRQGEQSVIPNPSLLNWPGDPRCLEVSCGGFFSFFKVEEPCTDARFYACGWGRDGCLGFGQARKRMLKPRPLPAIRGKTWTHIEAGMVHVGGLLATP